MHGSFKKLVNPPTVNPGPGFREKPYPGITVTPPDPDNPDPALDKFRPRYVVGYEDGKRDESALREAFIAGFTASSYGGISAVHRMFDEWYVHLV